MIIQVQCDTQGLIEFVAYKARIIKLNHIR